MAATVESPKSTGRLQKTSRSFAPILAALALAYAASPSGQGMAVVFRGVTVIPMDRERALSNQTVVVRDGRIAEIGSTATVAIPQGAMLVDGRDQFLMPTLAEMHAHVPAGQAASTAERVLFMYVANGVGTIRSMLGDASHLRLRDRVRRGELVGPTMYLAGPSFSGDTRTTEAAIRQVTEQKAAGYDLLKVLPGLQRNVFDALAATADKLRIRFAGHVPAAVGLRRALEAKYWTIDHLDGYVEALARPGAPGAQLFGSNLVDHLDESRVPALVADTRAAGTWNVPTLILVENWFGRETAASMRKRPEIRYATPSDVDQWVALKQKYTDAYPAEYRQRYVALRRRLLKALHDGGAGLLLGSDAPQSWNVPGFSIHRELASLVASGLTPYQALSTGTRNVATHFGTLDRTGTIEVGKRADFMLLQGNPLREIAHTSRIAGVMLGGRWLPKSEIDRRLDERR